jgi:hypothetical protein
MQIVGSSSVRDMYASHFMCCPVIVDALLWADTSIQGVLSLVLISI